MTTNKLTAEQELAEQLLRGSSASGADSESLSITDRLHKMFDADDLVEVKNFTKEKIGWVYSDRKELHIEQPNEFTRRVTQGAPKVRIVLPGKTTIVPGWEAYVGLTRFYKDWVQTTQGDDMMMSSPSAQQEFLSKAYLGIYDPNTPSEEPEEDVKAEVEKDLGLKDGKKSK